MAKTVLGKVGMTPRGSYSNVTEYKRLDVVTYDGCSYVCLKTCTGIAVTNTEYWQLIAEKGIFTEQDKESFKQAVVAESKTEMDTYTNGKKTEIDNYVEDCEDDLKSTLDSYETTKETELNGVASDNISAFNRNAESKTSDFNTNATNKTNEFNTNATTKTTEFNDNATEKIEDFNSNVTNKTEDFDNNASQKTLDFNNNAVVKTNEFNENADEVINTNNKITKLIDTEFDTNEAEGTTIDVDDCAEWDGIIGVGGNTEQKQLSGKNLFGVEALSGTFKGVTYSIEDSEILLNGTTEISGSIQKIAFKKTLPQGSYHIKQTQLSGSHVNEPTSNHCLSCVISDGSNNKYADKWLEALDTNFTLDESKQLYFVIYLLAGSSYTNFKFGIQIEEGSTATEYEQYCGGQESPNPEYTQKIKVVKGDNVVKHVGKNLFDSSFEEKKQYGVTFTYEDGIVTIDGKSSNQGLLELKNNLINKLKKGNYTVIFKYISGTKEDGAIRISIGNSRMQPLVEDSNRHFSFVISNSSQNIVQSKSFDEDREINKWGVYINTNITFTNYKFRLYVVEGTYTSNTIPTYEPYREENYRFDLGGKNIFNKDVEKKNSYPSTGIGSVVNYTNSSATDTYVNCCFLEKGKTYTFSWKQDETPASTNKRIGCLVDDNNVILSTFDTWESSINHRTITPSVSGYLILPMDKNATDIQIEEGTVATEYSRYMQNPIELCKSGNYEDVLFKNVIGSKFYNAELEEGAWYKKCLINKINPNSSDVWQIQSINTNGFVNFKTFRTNDYIWNQSNYNRAKSICNAFTYDESTIANVSKEGVMLTDSQSLYIRISQNRFKTVEELKNFLDENKVFIYYIMKDAVYEKITDPTLISQLEALLKVQMYHGVNHFYVETDNLEPIMELTYKQSNKIKNEKQNARLDNIESRLALLE